nr:unnamed protein product [Mus musculus]
MVGLRNGRPFIPRGLGVSLQLWILHNCRTHAVGSRVSACLSVMLSQGGNLTLKIFVISKVIFCQLFGYVNVKFPSSLKHPDFFFKILGIIFFGFYC